MIPNKSRENRKGRNPKMTKNIERLYKEGKCSECSVVVTRMDFAKILGKFTKVKIQYESGSTPKSKKNQLTTSPNSRLKNNENGMVLIHRNAYNQHPADLLKKSKVSDKPSPRSKVQETTPRVNNILKENNRLKKTPILKEKDSNYYTKSVVKSNLKRYGIIFTNPKNKNENNKNKISLTNLLPSINKNILPSEDWCIDYLPKHGEPKEDKVYDRIAAELEDLMNNEKSSVKVDSKADSGENKDDFLSIMDILNDNTTPQTNNQDNSLVQPNLESSDVEAMLLGNTGDVPPSEVKPSETMPMEVDNNDLSNLMDIVQLSTAQTEPSKLANDTMDNPNSPSILDETLQKGIEEHLPKEPVHDDPVEVPITNSTIVNENKIDGNDYKHSSVTHVVFKKNIDGVCSKSVTCPKNLKYSIELQGKSVEFLGAPKFITSLEDLKVLLQIVNETELSSLYVLY